MGRAKGKPNKGQPRGNRSASGRLRNRAVDRVLPCKGVAERHAAFSVPANDDDSKDEDRQRQMREYDTTDALGRAYCAGLLGSGERAKDLLVAGRKIARQYWVTYASVPGAIVRDSLDRFMPQEPGVPLSPEEREERDRNREQALGNALNAIRAQGREVRRAFDQLVIDFNPDFGPTWLDNILNARRGGLASERDLAHLALAMRGLDVIA